MLKGRAPLLQVQPVHIRHKDHRMGIPHGYACHRPFPSIHHDAPGKEALSGTQHRDALRREDGLSHVHADRDDGASLHMELQSLFPRQRLYGQFGLVRQPLVIEKFPHTANSVAAHLSLGAICVIHFHPEICSLGGADTDEPIGPHAKVAVRHAPRQSRQVSGTALRAVQIDVIVPQAVHFGEFHRSAPPSYSIVFGRRPQIGKRRQSILRSDCRQSGRDIIVYRYVCSSLPA